MKNGSGVAGAASPAPTRSHIEPGVPRSIQADASLPSLPAACLQGKPAVMYAQGLINYRCKNRNGSFGDVLHMAILAAGGTFPQPPRDPACDKPPYPCK